MRRLGTGWKVQMKDLFRRYLVVFMVLVMALGMAACSAGEAEEAAGADPLSEDPYRWNKLFKEYRNDAEVNQLVFVAGKAGSEAEMFLYVKDPEDNTWNRELETRCYVGKNGIGDASYCANITPEGVYGASTAFGIKKNPGTTMPYCDFNNDNLYCCGCQDSEFYNQLIDVTKVKHENCEGEHVIDYSPEYNYGMFLDYNSENDPEEDFAIFFHCEGMKEFTGGCIAVPEYAMKEILKKCDSGVKVCIYRRGE